MIPLLKLRKIKCVFYTLLIAFFFVACVNEDNQLGLDLVKTSGGMDVLSSGDNIVNVSSAVFGIDSLETQQNDNFVLGSYNDSYFGTVKTSIYTSLSLEETSGKDFSNMGVIDSDVLSLAYSRGGAFVKDTNIKNDNLSVNVYLLSQEIDSTKKYSKDEVPCESNSIFSGIVNADPLHGIKLEGDTADRIPHIRMTLNDYFLNKLKQGKYASHNDFVADFKGIKITATSSSNSFLAYINMISSQSGIYVYYHDEAGNKGAYMINFTKTGYRFMHIDKDYTSSALSVLQTPSSNDTLKTQDYIYLATMGVAEASLDLTGLDVWYNQDSIKGAALNRAELILPVAQVNTATYLFPADILTFRKQDGKYYYLEDQVAVSNWTGNKYDSKINAYRIDVTSYLQNYLKGNYDNCVIYLVPDGRISTASRVILSGTNSSNPPKLNIIYSHPSAN